MSNIVYRTIGQHVMALDLSKPDSEPTFVEGRERQRAFDLTQAKSTLMLRRCRDGCEKYFTSAFEATLCGPCEDEMRGLRTREDDEADEQRAHDLMVCAQDCNHCNYEETLNV